MSAVGHRSRNKERKRWQHTQTHTRNTRRVDKEHTIDEEATEQKDQQKEGKKKEKRRRREEEEKKIEQDSNNNLRTICRGRLFFHEIASMSGATSTSAP
jgi:uncharacterized protein (DUF1800 family)